MSAPHATAEIKDGIGWLTLNRREALNALSMEMRNLLIEHSAKFERDPAVRSVVIRGAGTHLMAGGDIRGFHESLTTDHEAHLPHQFSRVRRSGCFLQPRPGFCRRWPTCRRNQDRGNARARTVALANPRRGGTGDHDAAARHLSPQSFVDSTAPSLEHDGPAPWR